MLGTSPHLRLDDEYRTFLTLAAGQVAAAVADAQAVEAERRRAAERAELDRSRPQFFTEVAVTLQRAVLGPTVAAGGLRRPRRAGHRHAGGGRRLVRRRRPAGGGLRRGRGRRRRPRAGRGGRHGPAPQRRAGAAAGEPLAGDVLSALDRFAALCPAPR